MKRYGNGLKSFFFWAQCFTWLLFCASLSAEIVEELIFENPPFASCHASTLTETSAGELLCAYFAGSEEGKEDVGIWLSRRTKLGWGEPRLIAKETGAPCWNPVLFTLPSGEILLFYKVGLRPSSWSGAIKRSYDDGQNWIQEEPLPAGVIGPVKNRPLLLEDGTMLCGSSVESWRRWGCWIDFTRDMGRTWWKSSPINLRETLFGIIQPALFLDELGNICLLARSYDTGAICFSTSSDGGMVWTEARPIDLPNPNSGIDAIRLSHGPVALVYNHSSTERTPLNLAVSHDGGINWMPGLVLENQPGEYSYPSIIETRDGKIHVTYTYNRVNIKYVALEYQDLCK